MHQYNNRDLDTTPRLQVRESPGSNFGPLLACTETLCNKYHVREQIDLNPWECRPLHLCRHISMPLQDGSSGSHSSSLASPRRVWYMTNWLAPDYIWKLSTVGLANLTKSCMGLRKGEWQHKLVKWNLNKSNNITRTGSFLAKNSADMCPVMRAIGICCKRENLLATGQWSLLIDAEIL